VAPEIEDSPNDCQIIFEYIIYSIGKSLGQKSPVTRNFGMDTGIDREGVDVGEHGIEEVLANAFSLHLIKQASGIDIFHG